MCSASQDDLRDHYGAGEASTFMLSDTPAWKPDESSYDLSENLSKQIDSSATSAIPPTCFFNEPYPWAEDDEKEDVKDEFYLSDTSHNSSSSSNPDAHNYARDPRTPPMLSSIPNVYTKRENIEPYEAEEYQEEDGGKKRTLTYRERNRIAAHKCRQKNKQTIQELQQQEHDLAEKNRVLAAHVDHLKDEVLVLKSEILNHGNCEDELIQNYITKSAKKLRPS
ncbi:hypothetical protein SLS62_005385 [Diatrype stigma]|uniref:BZIP domain-containing protein n=1 Tax=Diatrype stigma TaxID=117547 RepID=A0AAN9YPR0_9PEZI